MLRSDGRKAAQMRQLSVEQGLLSKADGSSRIALGKTRVVAGVYGPAESLQRDELVEKAAIEVIFKTTDAEGAVEEKHLEETLAKCIDAVCLATLHPRTAIRIVLQLLADDGASFSATANAASVALLDAGIQMSTIFVAATVAVDASGALLVDPSRKEEADAVAVVDLVFDGNDGVLVSQCRGSFETPEQYFQCVELAHNMCTTLKSFIRKTTESRMELK